MLLAKADSDTMNVDALDTSDVDPARLLQTARRLFEEHDLRPSVVMAQTAIEVATENVLAAAFRARSAEDIGTPVLDLFTTFNLKNPRLYGVYQAVTHDDVKAADPELWRDFSEHIKRRNEVVHTGRKVSPAEAESSVDAAERFLAYLEGVLLSLEER
jgi:HEPN domain-containing protein